MSLLAACKYFVYNFSAQQHLHAGFDGNVVDGTSYLTTATDDADSIDLLFLHIAWDKAHHGSGCNSSNTLDDGTSSLQHGLALPADIAPAAGLNERQCANSSAALHQWLDDVVRLLLQYPTFSSSVLTAILLKNQEAHDMLQVCVLAAHVFARHLYTVKCRLLNYANVCEHA